VVEANRPDPTDQVTGPDKVLTLPTVDGNGTLESPGWSYPPGWGG
jgi:hypothetical protein